MGKFKTGDKVSYRDEHVNGVGTVHEYEGSGMYLVKVESKDDGWAYFVNNTCREFREKDLASVPAAWTIDAAVPGDVVTPTNWSGDYFTDGKPYEVSPASKIRSNQGYEYPLYAVNHGKWRLVTAASTTLTIEAGKFYTTRDGRKVGPSKVSEWPNGDWKWSLGQLWLFKDDGTSGGTDRKNDLVAEWVDEQPARASNDNAATLGDILQAALGKTVTVRVKRPDFKVGDTVRFKQSYGLARVRGKEAKVINVSDWGIQVDMNGDRSTERPESIELVTPAAPANPAIVALIENGQPKPAVYPHVHADEGAASKEASRLASVYKGQKFGVYVLTQTVSEGQIYAHEWQNLAANGNKIGAIKALRELASLDLLSAKKAVEVFVEKAA